MTRWSTTTATSRRCCCASTRRSRCRSPTATPRRAASRSPSSCTTSSGCCTPPWASTTPIPTARRSSSSARPARWTKASAARASIGQHTANVQGTQVRDYVKWDYQPGGIDGVVDSFARAYSIMMTEPQGPIYMCYDAALQEAPLEAPIKPADRRRSPKTPSRIAPDPTALDEAADRLVEADWPVLLPQFVGRDRERLVRHGGAGRDAGRAGGRHACGG